MKKFNIKSSTQKSEITHKQMYIEDDY